METPFRVTDSHFVDTLSVKNKSTILIREPCLRITWQFYVENDPG